MAEIKNEEKKKVSKPVRTEDVEHSRAITDDELQKLKEKYPSNNKHNEDSEPKKTVKGKIKKKGAFSKIYESLVGEDVVDVKKHIVHEVIIPNAKDLIYEVIEGGIRMFLFQDSGGGSRRRGTTMRTSGRGVYTNHYTSTSSRKSGRRTYEAKRRPEMYDVEFESREEASIVLEQLLLSIEEYGLVTLSDFYSACEITGDFTDSKWGWSGDMLAYVDVRRRSGAFYLDLPNPEPIT